MLTTMPLWQIMAETPLTALILETRYGYPAMEIIHIFGFVLMAGSIAMLDFRLLGFGPKLPVKVLANYLLPWTWLGFAMSLIAGGTLFVVKAPEWIIMPVFQLKIALVMLGCINAVVFHYGAYRRIHHWNIDTAAPWQAKTSAVFSLLIWAATLACGRLLAYFGFG